LSNDDTKGVALSMRVKPLVLNTVPLAPLTSLVPMAVTVTVAVAVAVEGEADVVGAAMAVLVRALEGPDVAGEGIEASAWVGSLLVRGRFNFLSGS
jgi:hypothetical protein